MIAADLVFEETAKLFSGMRCSILQTHQQCMRSSHPTFLSALGVVTMLYLSHSDRFVAILHCGFNLRFPDG